MDEEDTGPWLRELRTEIEARKARRDEITDLISDQPVASSVSTFARIHKHLEPVIADRHLRRAQKLGAEIRITAGDEIIPVFPVPSDAPATADTAATSTGDASEPDPVRAMPHLVGPTRQYAKRMLTVSGSPLPMRTARSRRSPRGSRLPQSPTAGA